MSTLPARFYAVTQTVSVGLVPGIPRLCVVGIAEGDGAARLDALARLHHWHPELSSAVADAWASTLSLIRDDMTGAAVDRSERWLPPLPDSHDLHQIAVLRERVTIAEMVDDPCSDDESPQGAPQNGRCPYIAVTSDDYLLCGLGYSIEGARTDAARRLRFERQLEGLHQLNRDENRQDSPAHPAELRRIPAWEEDERVRPWETRPTALNAPLSADYKSWAAQLLVFRLVDTGTRGPV